KKEPLKLEVGLGIDWIDNEGRVILAEYENIKVFSIYAPSGSSGDERQALKMEFLDHFMSFVRNHIKGDMPVLFCGVFNICHKALDINITKRIKIYFSFLMER